METPPLCVFVLVGVGGICVKFSNGYKGSQNDSGVKADVYGD